jgi:hypothetical protein
LIQRGSSMKTPLRRRGSAVVWVQSKSFLVAVPGDFAVGLNDQQAVGSLVAAPEVDFLLDPR